MVSSTEVVQDNNQSDDTTKHLPPTSGPIRRTSGRFLSSFANSVSLKMNDFLRLNDDGAAGGGAKRRKSYDVNMDQKCSLKGDEIRRVGTAGNLKKVTLTPLNSPEKIRSMNKTPAPQSSEDVMEDTGELNEQASGTTDEDMYKKSDLLEKELDGLSGTNNQNEVDTIQSTEVSETPDDAMDEIDTTSKNEACEENNEEDCPPLKENVESIESIKAQDQENIDSSPKVIDSNKRALECVNDANLLSQEQHEMKNNDDLSLANQHSERDQVRESENEPLNESVEPAIVGHDTNPTISMSKSLANDKQDSQVADDECSLESKALESREEEGSTPEIVEENVLPDVEVPPENEELISTGVNLAPHDTRSLSKDDVDGIDKLSVKVSDTEFEQKTDPISESKCDIKKKPPVKVSKDTRGYICCASCIQKASTPIKEPEVVEPTYTQQQVDDIIHSQKIAETAKLFLETLPPLLMYPYYKMPAFREFMKSVNSVPVDKSADDTMSRNPEQEIDNVPNEVLNDYEEFQSTEEGGVGGSCLSKAMEENNTVCELCNLPQCPCIASECVKCGKLVKLFISMPTDDCIRDCGEGVCTDHVVSRRVIQSTEYEYAGSSRSPASPVQQMQAMTSLMTAFKNSPAAAKKKEQEKNYEIAKKVVKDTVVRAKIEERKNQPHRDSSLELLDKTVYDEHEYLELMRRLSEGLSIKRRAGATVSKTKLLVNDDITAVYWKSGIRAGKKSISKKNSIVFSEITNVFTGMESPTFKKYGKQDKSDYYVSIVSPNNTLDIEAEDEITIKTLVTGFKHLQKEHKH